MKNKKIDISVVMPVYNSETYLGEAIESILQQTFTNFEFIIVCEYGTSEKSLEIVEQYAEKDSRIVIAKNTEKLGISASLNVGIRLAKGKYIARMDADDVSSSRRFEIQKMYMDTYEEIGICGIRHKVIGDKNWIVDYGANPLQLECELLFMSVLRHPSIMIRKSVIEEFDLFYDESLAGVEDYELYLRASKYTKLTNILDDDLFYHRRGKENLSLVFRERDNEIQLSILRKHYTDKFEINFSDEDINRLSVVTFLKDCQRNDYSKELAKLNKILIRLRLINEQKQIYSEEYLEKAFFHRWMRAMYTIEVKCGENKFEDLKREWRKGEFYRAWMN